MKASFVFKPSPPSPKTKKVYLLVFLNADVMTGVLDLKGDSACSDGVWIDHVPTAKEISEYQESGDHYLGYLEVTI